MEKYILSSSSS